MKKDDIVDELDLEEERYFNVLGFDEEEFVDDLDAPPVGDFDDDELLDDVTDEEKLISDNFLFGDDESYEDEVAEVDDDLEEDDFESDFFSKELDW